jgi:iron complex outermembrane receptor protein
MMSRSVRRRRQALLSSVRAFPVALLGCAAVVGALSVASARAQDAAPAAAAPAPAAPAAAAAGSVEEVTITARDRAEKAQDVPLPISAIGAKTADREHVENWKELTQKIPSFSPAVANPRTGANGLRGITGISGGTDGSEGGVGIIVDNVFYTHIGFSWLTTYDIDSIQVARGPQGTLLGKNTTIGAVIVNTKEPSFEPQTTTETSFGTRRLVEEKVTNTGTLIPDTLAYRVSAFGKRQDGFINNLYDTAAPKGQDVDRWGVRGQLLGTFGDITDRLIIEHDASNETNNSWGYFNDGWTKNFDGSNRVIKAVNPSGTTITSNSPQGVLAALFPQFASRIGANPWADPYTNIGSIVTHTNGVSNELNWRLGDYTLTSVSAWRQFDFHPNNSNGDFGINNYANNITGYDVDVNQWSQELRISSPTGEKVDWTGGTYFLREIVNTNSRRVFGSDAVALVSRNATGTGIYDPKLLNGVESDRFGRAGITNFAQFGQLNYHYDEKATLTLGVRNSYEVRTSSDAGYYFGGVSDASLTAAQKIARVNDIINAAQGTNFYIADTQHTDTISYLINPSYKFNDNITGYFNAGRGVKSGAANTDAVPVYNTGVTNALYPIIGYQKAITAPETAYDFELGFKSNWLDNRLQLNANVYLNEIYNFQAKLVNWYTYTDSSGNLNYIANNYIGNVPHVRLAGFETDGRYSPLENLWVTWAGAYNGSWYVQYRDAAPPADYAAVTGASKIVDMSGKRIPFVTPYTLSLGANYEYVAGAFLDLNWKGYVYGNGTYKSTTIFSYDTYTRYILKQPDYVVFNAGIGFRSDDEKYDISVWGKNIFNRKAYLALGGQTAALSTNTALATVQWIDPLTVGVTLRTKF